MRRSHFLFVPAAMALVFATGTAQSWATGGQNHDKDKTEVSSFVGDDCKVADKLVIPISTHAGGDRGSKKVLLSNDVAGDLKGKTAKVVFKGENNGSVREGSNLVVDSGDDSVTVENVEQKAGKVTTAEGELTLGDKITISVVFGPDKGFSGGGDLIVAICEDEPTTPVVPTTELNCDTAATMTVPIETHFSGKAGSSKSVLSQTVPAALKGKEVQVKFEGDNNGSVRQGSNLVLSSGTDKITLENIEEKAGKVTTTEGTLVLGDKVDFSVVLGPEGAFSGGGKVVLTLICEPETPVTTPPTTPPVTPPTTPPTIPVEVQDEVIVPPTPAPTPAAPVEVQELAYTGTSTATFAFFGLASMLAGLVFLYAANIFSYRGRHFATTPRQR